MKTLGEKGYGGVSLDVVKNDVNQLGIFIKIALADVADQEKFLLSWLRAVVTRSYSARNSRFT